MPREQIYKETFVVIEVALVNLYQAHFFCYLYSKIFNMRLKIVNK